ncbi:MAG: YcjF family protein [Verrucomicrobia bacterium]|nr:YcjF family protein [Verrucomicrobiota bacterium]
MLQRVWRIAQFIVIGFCALCLFFVTVEFLRAYVILRDVHPMLGGIFAMALGLGALMLLLWYLGTMGSRPQVLHAPVGVEPATAAGRPLRAYARFQVRLMRRLAANPNLEADLQERLQRQTERLREALAAGDEAADLRRCVLDAEELAIAPALVPLDQQARQEVARGVRDVMLAVTLSPWRSADLVVVFYRNVRMVMRLAAIYNSRPPLREQGAIVRDVFMVVASVNIFNYGSNLLQNLTSSVPLLGRFADDIAEGVGAGLMTSVTGHAALGRCRSYGRWNQEEAENSIRRKLREFLDDVKCIVVSDVLQRIRKPVEAQVPAASRPPRLQEEIRQGVTTAIDETSSIMDALIFRPVTTVGRTAVDRGVAVSQTIAHGGAITWRSLMKRVQGGLGRRNPAGSWPAANSSDASS